MFGKSACELRSAFDRDGFAIAKGVFDADECAEMVAQVWTRMPPHFRPDQPATWTGRIQDCCNTLPLYQRNGLLRYKDRQGFRSDPVFGRHIYSNPRLSDLFEAVSGRAMARVHIRGLHPIMPMPRWVSVNEIVGNRFAEKRLRLRIPRPPQLPIPGHIDAHSVDILMMVYIDTVSIGGGGLSVWPGSHHLLRDCFESLHDFLPTPAYRRSMKMLQRYRPVQLAGRAGDVILFDNRLLHSNSFNHSARIRHALLLDTFAEGWRERDRLWREDPAAHRRRQELASTNVASSPAARRVSARLSWDPIRAFWARHPRLRGWVSEIAKDPLGKARRQLSAKIRMRREGDFWIVVSQGAEHKGSGKLDAYGCATLGSFRISVNGGPAVQSIGGSLVERIVLKGEENIIDIAGRFGVDHYVRVIRSRIPLDRSDILHRGVIAAVKGDTGHRILVPGSPEPFDDAAA